METSQLAIHTFMYLAGWSQIVLVIGSFAIPHVLNWKTELRKVSILIKQMFWTYAAYVLGINLSFGLLSVFAADELLNGSLLAKIVCGFIAVYWISRIVIQFFYFDRKAFPKGSGNQLAEIILIALFIFLSIIYSTAFYFNIH